MSPKLNRSLNRSLNRTNRSLDKSTIEIEKSTKKVKNLIDKTELSKEELLEERFKKTEELVNDYELDEEQKRQFKALSRQAKEGNNNDPKPGMFSLFSSDMYNWQAYENLRGLKQNDAMEQYILK